VRGAESAGMAGFRRHRGGWAGGPIAHLIKGVFAADMKTRFICAGLTKKLFISRYFRSKTGACFSENAFSLRSFRSKAATHFSERALFGRFFCLNDYLTRA
jgi:hypothetical protein